jgi:translation initiation factor 2-alpha kinase 4
MAGKQSGVWNTTPSGLKNNNKNESSFPGLLAASPEVNNKIEYGELQQNELLALEAIYSDDFVMHTETQNAWKVIFEEPLLPYRDPSSWPTLKLTTYNRSQNRILISG